MGSFSIWHWMIVLVVVLILFGRGRVSEIMGDFGKGIKSFKEGMNDEQSPRKDTAPPAQITVQPVEAQPTPAPSTASESTKDV